MPLEIDRVPSPIGDILLVVERDAAADLLVSLDFAEYEYRMDHFNTRRYGDMRPQPATNPAGMSDRLRRYLAGDLHAFDDAAVRTSGTPFQERVWAALRTIPAGTTTTYGALAATLGNGKASRAVGLANSLNPVAICVPCHRVVGANARLTGYAGGLERKRWLLAHEAGASVRQASLDFDAQPVMYGRPLRGKEDLSRFGIPVWSGHVFGLLMRPCDRWPRWVSRISLLALRRALLRDDVSECSDPGPDHFAIAAFGLLTRSPAGRL